MLVDSVILPFDFRYLVTATNFNEKLNLGRK